MNDMMKTGAIVAGAVALAVVASLLGPREIKHDLYSDQGQEFFPLFTDAATATDLEVTEFDEKAAEPRKFAVKRDSKGSWTIPSHGNYPADAKDRMGKAAAMMIGLRKERNASDRKEDHVAFGVVDPLDESTEAKGRGKRVTMKDSAGNVLADLIIGKAVEGKTDVHYVCLPGKRRVYSTKVAGELSTKFADWIETDLLKAQSWDIGKITFDNYSVDEQKGEVVPGEKLVLNKDSAGKWSLDGIDASKQETVEEKTREINDTLTQIKIVGVRTKPEGLTAALQQATGFDRQILGQMMAQKGYFLGRGGQLFSNEGDLLFETKKGVRYTLRFGELVSGEGDAITSGAESKPNKPKEGETGPQAAPANNRYLMVTAEFVEALLQKPTGQRLPKEQLDKRLKARDQIAAIVAAVDAWKSKHEGKLPESLAKLTEKPAEGEALLPKLEKDPWDGDYVLQAVGEGFAVVSFADGKAEGGEGASTDVRSDRFPLEDEFKKAADEWTEYDKKVEDGRKEADKLTRRFGPWYYVIDQALFAKLKPQRKDLVKDKPAAPPTPAPGTGEPGKEPGK
jgi:hypothetical protein